MDHQFTPKQKTKDPLLIAPTHSFVPEVINNAGEENGISDFPIGFSST